MHFWLHITTASMRSYLKKTNQPHRQLVLWVDQMLDQLSNLLMHPLWHTKNASLVAHGNISDITTDKLIEAFKLLDGCISTLCKFESGTGTIPSCPVLHAEDLKQAIQTGLTKLHSTSQEPKRAANKQHKTCPSHFCYSNSGRPLQHPHLQMEAGRDDAIHR